MRGYSKCILAFFLIAVLTFFSAVSVFAVVPSYPVSDSYTTGEYYSKLLNTELSGDMRKDIVAVAKSQVGYHEGSSLSQLSGYFSGSSNYAEYFNYIDYYHRTYKGWDDSLQAQGGWCSAFVSFCAYVAGVPFDVLVPSAQTSPTTFGLAGPSALAGSDLKNFYDLAVMGGSYIPLPGDIIFFGYSNSRNNPLNVSYKHTGIVESCDVTYNESGMIESMTINTIEGNSSDSVKENSWTVKPDSTGWIYSSTYIAAFGVPDYKAGTPSYPVYDIGAYGGTLLRKGDSSSSVLTLQITLGLLAELKDAPPACGMTGTFDAATADAVSAFQTEYGLEVDGIVGGDTWKCLRSALVSYTSKVDGDFIMKDNALLFYKGKGESAVLPDHCASISPYAFYGADSLKTLTRPRCLSVISENAFFGCTSVERIIFTGRESEAAGLSHLPVLSNGSTVPVDYIPQKFTITYRMIDETVIRSCEIDCIPDYTCTQRVEKDGTLYFFSHWNKQPVPATQDTEYVAIYYTETASRVQLYGLPVVSAQNRPTGVTVAVDTPAEISALSFSLNYSDYLDMIGYIGVSDPLPGLCVDSSVPGIITVSSTEDFKPVSGHSSLLTLDFLVDRSSPDGICCLFLDNACAMCSDGQELYGLNVSSGLAEIHVETLGFFDFDGSGDLSIADVSFLLDMLSGNFPASSGADYTVSDVTRLLDILAK